jgi:predicted O-linked N-acetylglucosamine transferase (SPINDLY family)
MIREDRIDILVDLALHTAGGRLPLFARKPAPVQVTFLGYCSTTGLDAIDYRLSDPYLDPPDADLALYSEQTIRLRRTYWCYEPLGSVPPVAPAPALGKGYLTFGCLNNFAKVSTDAVESWAEILLAVPTARLLLQAPSGSSRAAILQRFAGAGIQAERVKFVGRQPWEQYVESLQGIDIVLDPFPYGGGVTTSDALWMGVPVVTLSGRTAIGRGGRSILSNLGLTELVAETPRQYVELAVSLAEDLPRLFELRAGLRGRMERSPLCDAAGYAADLETAYREMWRRWCLERKAA